MMESQILHTTISSGRLMTAMPAAGIVLLLFKMIANRLFHMFFIDGGIADNTNGKTIHLIGLF